MQIVRDQSKSIHLRVMMKRSLQEDSYLEKSKTSKKAKREKPKSKFEGKNKRKKFDDYDWDERD